MMVPLAQTKISAIILVDNGIIPSCLVVIIWTSVYSKTRAGIGWRMGLHDDVHLVES